MAEQKIGSHRDLTVWQKSMDLVVEVYRLSSRFPKDETYRLTAQITRAAASVPANIAEGHARSTARDYGHFLSIAKGSLMETETFLMLSVRLGTRSGPRHRSQQDAHVAPLAPAVSRCRLSPVTCPL